MPWELCEMNSRFPKEFCSKEEIDKQRKKE